MSLARKRISAPGSQWAQSIGDLQSAVTVSRGLHIEPVLDWDLNWLAHCADPSSSSATTIVNFVGLAHRAYVVRSRR